MSSLGNGIVLACLLLSVSNRCLSATHDMFSCFTDVCNRYDVDQFCSMKERRCRDCSTIRDECSTLNLPVNCTNWCIQYNKEQALLKAKAQACPKLNEIANGIYNASYNESFQLGFVVAVTCNVGYRLAGISILKCRDYGYWSDREPKCEEILCPPLNKTEHGSLNGSLDVKYKPGTIIAYSCNDIFTLVGSTTTSCNAEGQWTNHPPVCNVWTRIAIAALACLAGSLLIWSVIECRRWHRRKRRKQKNKRNPSTTKVNGSRKGNDFTESKQLLKTVNEPENDISLQERKHRRQNAVVTDGTASNREPSLAEPNFPTASSVRRFANNSQVQDRGMQIQFNSYNCNIAEPQVVYDRNDKTKGPDASAGETELKKSKTADKISVEESATTPTAQPEAGNDSLVKLDVAGNTVVYEKQINGE